VTLKTSVKDVREDSLTLIDESGEEYSYAADLVIFTAGTEQSPFVRAIDAEKDRFGRLVTRDTLQLKDFPNVFSLGDCSSVEGQQNPSTAQGKGAVCVCVFTYSVLGSHSLLRRRLLVAMQQAGTAASNLVKYLTFNATDSEALPSNERMSSFKYLSLGEMLSLGLTDGAITSLGGLIQLSGPLAGNPDLSYSLSAYIIFSVSSLAAIGRRVVYAVRMPTASQQAKALLTAGAVTAGKLLKSVFD
jgi:NADH dehydrogenase FAD-containing subunit